MRIWKQLQEVRVHVQSQGCEQIQGHSRSLPLDTTAEIAEIREGGEEPDTGINKWKENEEKIPRKIVLLNNKEG